jgi:chromate transporter
MIRDYFTLFGVFAKVGVMTFGGGYAMLPILQRELAEKRDWTTQEELSDYYAIGQCTPGVIAVNTATFVGSKRLGTIGGIVATLGVVFPSIVIIMAIAAFLQNFADLQIVKNAFAGIRVGVCALVLNAILKLWKKSLVDFFALAIFLALLAVSVFTDVSPVWLVLAGGIGGILIQTIRAKSGKQGKAEK